MSKGAAYEQDVLNTLQGELSRGNLGIDPNLARVRFKPNYFSRDRDKDIIFDVSIEVFRKDAAEPYWIWIWECKNYSHTVPVDDVEEFHAKLSQVGADRTKGSMITLVGFDLGSVKFARSKGIGLWRLIPPGSPVCLMEDSSGAQDSDILCALTTPDTTAFRFYGFFYGLTCDGRLTTDQEELLRHEFRDAS
jgi:hypothetical protein